MSKATTQLITPDKLATFDVSNLVFSDKPTESKFGKFVNIQTRNEDGTVGELMLETPYLSSMGIRRQTEYNNPDVHKGYTLPLSLWKTQPTPEQQTWYNVFEDIVSAARHYILSNPDMFSKRLSNGKIKVLDESSLENMSPITLKVDLTTGLPKFGPSLFPKLIAYNKDGEWDVQTTLYLPTGEEITDVEQYVDRPCTVKAVIRVESIFIGQAVKLQIKVWEACIEPIETTRRLLLNIAPPANASYNTSNNTSNNRYSLTEASYSPPPLEVGNSPTSFDDIQDSDNEDAQSSSPVEEPVTSLPPRRRAVARK